MIPGISVELGSFHSTFSLALCHLNLTNFPKIKKKKEKVGVAIPIRGGTKVQNGASCQGPCVARAVSVAVLGCHTHFGARHCRPPGAGLLACTGPAVLSDRDHGVSFRARLSAFLPPW